MIIKYETGDIRIFRTADIRSPSNETIMVHDMKFENSKDITYNSDERIITFINNLGEYYLYHIPEKYVSRVKSNCKGIIVDNKISF